MRARERSLNPSSQPAVRLDVAHGESLRFDLIDHVMVIVHGDTPPTDEDWSRMSVVRNASGNRVRGTLVIAPPRASINAAQRAEVAAFMRATGSSVAVVTDSALIRGVARAVGFLGVNVQAFPSTQVPAALSSLLVPVSRHAEFLRRIEGMQAHLARIARAG